ncbi:MAG: CDP-alcohol phosphatidyltransferase family protein [Gemmatimonadetes bacterium]|nr:CDP-alcohol phosphatidyltransferase family protein [Gemmatimonadota bacterium]
MASIYDLKPKFQGLLRPLTNALARGGVTANQVTLAAMLLSLAVGAAVALRPSAGVLLLVPLTLFLRMAFNAIDGMLAREHGQKSRLGAVLNELGDVVSDAGLYLPFARVLAGEAALVVGIVLVAVIGEMTGVVGIQVGASRRYDGPMGKSDRAFWFGLLALLLGLGVAAGAWVRWYLAVVLLLGVVTILNRARGALREGA